MRTSILSAAILGLFAAGCAGELSGTGEGDDVQAGPDCGNGATDTGETCDDGNTTSGDGCSASCQTETSSTPKLAVAVDKTTVATELNTTTMLTVTLTSQGGFAGAVNLTGTVEDTAGTAIPGWAVTFNNATIDVAADGTASAVATVKVPSNSGSLVGKVKINAGSTLGTSTATSDFTALNRVTIEVTNNGTQCVYPAAVSNLTLKVDTTIRFVNKFAADVIASNLITIHVQDGGDNGVDHEPNPGHLIDTAYEKKITATGAGGFTWYCHAPGPNPGGAAPAITVVP
jgi:cysteine-rich repeat protein